VGPHESGLWCVCKPQGDEGRRVLPVKGEAHVRTNVQQPALEIMQAHKAVCAGEGSVRCGGEKAV